MNETLPIEVVYALPARQEIIRLTLPTGSTLSQAIQASGLLEKYPEIDLAGGKFGIFSKLSKPDTVLRAQDRVEIYRPLIADPRAARATRAEKAATGKSGMGKTITAKILVEKREDSKEKPDKTIQPVTALPDGRAADANRVAPQGERGEAAT